MKAKRAALAEALTGRFDDHHAELARILLDQIDVLTARVGQLTGRAEELIGAIPAARGGDADGTTGPARGRARTRRPGQRSPGWVRFPASAGTPPR
jgi:transposase